MDELFTLFFGICLIGLIGALAFLMWPVLVGLILLGIVIKLLS